MNLNNYKNLQNIKNELLNNSKTLIISAGNSNDFPEIGYAPFIIRDNFFYIYSSILSPHIKHILDKKSGSFMLIQDESKTKNIWSRIRLKFYGKINVINRKNLYFNNICNEFEKYHGKTMSIIRSFKDFHLIKINPIKGSLITGFGNAYNLKGKELKVIKHIKT